MNGRLKAFVRAKPGTAELEKLCADCETWLPLEKFYSNRAGKGGRHTYCAVCATKRTLAAYYRRRAREHGWHPREPFPALGVTP